jgi:oxygen-independent coproporphyrinogen III oxidase
MNLSAYIHIPFCAHKCDFCDFAAYAGLDHLTQEYCNIVCREIEERLGEQDSRACLSSVFYGGGTPGLVAPEFIEAIHRKLLGFVDLTADVEIDLETTPHAITAAKAKQWLDLGVNRISIGLESLQDSELAAIGRDHTVNQALAGVKLAAQAGFENVNVDLMYGLPGQDAASLTKTLSILADLCATYSQIKHVSAYGLQLAPHSPLLLTHPIDSKVYPTDDQFAEIYELLVGTLSAMGFEQYEISNFSRPGYQSRHNLNYWDGGDYLAFGVSAHRYLAGKRSANWRSLKKYMEDPLGLELEETIEPVTRLKEAIMLGLRTRRGIDPDQFEKAYGVKLLDKYARPIKKLQDGNMLEIHDGRLRLTSQAVPVSNLVISEFF